MGDYDHPLSHSSRRGSGAVLARIAEGLALVRSNKRLTGVLIVTVIYNLRVAFHQHDPRHRA
jgi:hypothetical protein